MATAVHRVVPSNHGSMTANHSAGGTTSTATTSRADLLARTLQSMDQTTADAHRCCDLLTKRARQLDSLTSPASDASSMLSRANANLATAVVLMKDARDKFDTVTDCEPAVKRLHRGVQDLEQMRLAGRSNRPGTQHRTVLLTEQDIYAAGDALEILRDAHDYFARRNDWKSTPATLAELERVCRQGTDAMCLLVASHLKKAGQAVRPKRHKRDAVGAVPPTEETAQQTRQRLAAALQNRNLLKSIGEFEEFQPCEARPTREVRSLFECLGSHGYTLGGGSSKREPAGLAQIFGIPANRVLRTEKVGSGCYTSLVRQPLKTGFPQLDAYGEARKEVAFQSFDNYYRRIKVERKKRIEKLAETAGGGEVDAGGFDEADAAARDAVRCLEHAMIAVAGEKSVYKTIVAPALQMTVNHTAKDDDDDDGDHHTMSPYFRKGCAAAYSFVVASIVDRTLDIIETVFLKEGGIGQTSGSKGGGALTVRGAASAAAAGLRMLDGVRMLGPSLAKLCEMQVGDGVTNSNSSLSATLCIAIHRTTVKNCARTLENLAKAIQEDPMKGAFHAPKDASVSSVSRDVVHAIRLISPFVSAYKSVSKRRSLPWDPNMGEDAGEMDAYVRYLIMRLLNSLKGKAINYTKDGRSDGEAKSNLFMMNNAFFILEELGPNSLEGVGQDSEYYRIEGSWFSDKVSKIMDSEKAKYLCAWEQLNTHLTAVASNELEYQKNDNTVLSHDSGRLIKQRFSGFNDDFEVTYGLHLKLCIIDQRLRTQLQQDVASVFLPRYHRFYEKYTKIKFSKKHQSEYTKYSPDKIEDMLLDMYVDPIDPL